MKRLTRIVSVVIALGFLSGCDGFNTAATHQSSGRSFSALPQVDGILAAPEDSSNPEGGGDPSVPNSPSAPNNPNSPTDPSVPNNPTIPSVPEIPSNQPTTPLPPPLPEPDPQEKMASITSADEFLPSLGSMLGVNPSTETYNDYFYKKLGNTKDWRSLLSEFGNYDSVSSAMWMIVISMSGDMCRDLVEKEKSKSGNNRKFFVNIDLSGSNLSRSAFDGAIRRLARSLWGRNETTEESNLIFEEIATHYSDSNYDAMMVTCSSMASTIHTHGRGI